MMQARFSIGQLSLATACKIETIRYYEKTGLLPEPERTSGNQRRYGEDHYKRLLFILHARELGFPIKTVRQLITLSGNPDALCGEADAIARQQLGVVRERIRRLQLLEKVLESISETCEGHNMRDCRVIETLAACNICYDWHHQL